MFVSRIYYWYDERGKKTKCTAPQYVDFVMSLVQKLVTDDDIFPTKYGEFKLWSTPAAPRGGQSTALQPLPGSLTSN